MTNSNSPDQKNKNNAGGGWRYKLGIIMFILPIIMIVITPIVVPFFGMSATDTAALIGGTVICGEVIWFASIPFLGKEGFKKLKNQLFSRLKLNSGSISKTRHSWGLVLFGGALAFQLLVLVWIVGGFFYLGPEHLAEGVAGLTFAEEATGMVYMIIASVGAFFAGIWMLGGDFVDRLQTALVWQEGA